MRISTKGRYALRMLLDLAKNDRGDYISLKDIAERQGISKKYLEQIVASLNKEDILDRSRGYLGGYKLAKSPREYRIGDILRLTEGSLAPILGLETGADIQEPESLLFVWNGLYDTVTKYLDGITLQDIIDQDPANTGDLYYI